MRPVAEVSKLPPINRIANVFKRQRSACLKNPYPNLEQRRTNLLKLEQLLRDNQDAIAEAINQDFSNRSVHETKLLEIFASIDGLKDCRRRLKKWMKPQKRHVSMWFAGAKNRVLPQPKGVVGVVVPWNYPLFLCIGPVTSALAAGNRCMVKMAANSQHLCRLLAKLVGEKFDDDTLAILPGVSAADFTDQPYDHLLFTGSPAVGKTVMRKAADYLTPVTLELGGKSPTIVCDDFDIGTAATRIVQGKLYNAGQTCVAPDYVFVPEDKVDAFIERAQATARHQYPTLDSKDLTSIIDQRAFERLQQVLDDAVGKGAKAIALLNSAESNEVQHKIAPTLLLGVQESMTAMQEEIFGPILPIKTYRHIDEVLRYINNHPRPLALYLFTHDKEVQENVLKNTLSGGVSINDCMLHVAQHDMPFGGIGNSGMGHYHGFEGFLELSKMRPIFTQSRIPGNALLTPPYGKLFNFLYKLMVGR